MKTDSEEFHNSIRRLYANKTALKTILRLFQIAQSQLLDPVTDFMDKTSGYTPFHSIFSEKIRVLVFVNLLEIKTIC